jgi:hypothetical protein
MRFREKFGPLGWFVVSLACFYACDWFFLRGPSTSTATSALRGFDAAVWTCLALLIFLKRRSAYWDLDSDGLHQRRFGSKKELTVAWEKVTVVRNVIPGISWDGTVAVYYELPGSKLGFGRIVAVPERRKVFIESLQRFAPQAKFNV